MANKDVQAQVNAILQEYIDTERETIEKVTKDVAEQTRKLLRKTSPRSKRRGGKHYAGGWRVNNSKTVGMKSVTSVVYNATKPQLTHLLTRPHDIKNQFGEYGRSTPDPHLEDAEEFGINLYLKELEKKL